MELIALIVAIDILLMIIYAMMVKNVLSHIIIYQEVSVVINAQKMNLLIQYM